MPNWFHFQEFLNLFQTVTIFLPIRKKMTVLWLVKHAQYHGNLERYSHHLFHSLISTLDASLAPHISIGVVICMSVYLLVCLSVCLSVGLWICSLFWAEVRRGQCNDLWFHLWFSPVSIHLSICPAPPQSQIPGLLELQLGISDPKSGLSDPKSGLPDLKSNLSAPKSVSQITGCPRAIYGQ